MSSRLDGIITHRFIANTGTFSTPVCLILSIVSFSLIVVPRLDGSVAAAAE